MLVFSMPDLRFPPDFSAMSRDLSSAFNLDFVTEIGEANCSLGSDHCFRIMVMMPPLHLPLPLTRTLTLGLTLTLDLTPTLTLTLTLTLTPR